MRNYLAKLVAVCVLVAAVAGCGHTGAAGHAARSARTSTPTPTVATPSTPVPANYQRREVAGGNTRENAYRALRLSYPAIGTWADADIDAESMRLCGQLATGMSEQDLFTGWYQAGMSGPQLDALGGLLRFAEDFDCP